MLVSRFKEIHFCSDLAQQNGIVSIYLGFFTKDQTDQPPCRNFLFLPFRKTHSISLSSAIEQYISTKYDQHPDMFTRDLEAIDRLRADAVHSLEPHTSGIRKLTAYAAQLVWLGGKFPIDVSESQSLRCHTVVSVGRP